MELIQAVTRNLKYLFQLLKEVTKRLKGLAPSVASSLKITKASNDLF